MKTFFPALALCLLFLTGCQPESQVRPYVQDSEDYYPLTIGHFVEYQVDSIVLDDAPGGNTRDTVRFQLREEINGFDIGPFGDTVYHVRRFRRPHEHEDWSLRAIWTTHIRDNKVLRTEENLTFHKMTLPLYPGQRWVPTSYIPFQTVVRIGTEFLEMYQYWQSRILGIDESGMIGDFQFPPGHLMRISVVDEDDDLNRRFVHEVYARGIGLVSRTDTILDSRCIQLGDFTPCLDKPWLVHASKGYILSQTLISHH